MSAAAYTMPSTTLGMLSDDSSSSDGVPVSPGVNYSQEKPYEETRMREPRFTCVIV